MSRLKFLLLAAGLTALPLPLMAATPGAVQAEQSPVMPGPSGGFAGQKGGKLAAFFTPEQRAAFFLMSQEQTKGMTPDQRRAWRQTERQKLIAMSDTDRQKFKADLQARWDSLPPDRKNRIEQRLAQRNGPPPAQ